MIERDYSIIKAVERFHCLSRDDIIALFFSQTKSPITAANKILRRLIDRSFLKVDRDASPFMYFPAGSKMAFNSQKIIHYRAIFKVYMQMARLGALRRFDIEPRFGGKGTVEPDAFAIWHGTPFFVEVQLSNYTSDIMLKKIARYEQYHVSRSWEMLDWQRKNNKVFPIVWIIGDRQYSGIPNVIQTKTVQEMYDKMRKLARTSP